MNKIPRCIVAFSKAIDKEEVVKTYVNLYNKVDIDIFERCKWVDILYKDYEWWDDEGVAPKQLYVLDKSLNELEKVSEYREWCFNKGKRYSERQSVYNDHVKFDLTMNPIDFYSQFTQQELAAIGAG